MRRAESDQTIQGETGRWLQKGGHTPVRAALEPTARPTPQPTLSVLSLEGQLLAVFI